MRLVRTPLRLAFACLAFVGAVALAPSTTRAQGIAVNQDLAVPDLPCMTAEERRSLQQLADEQSVTWAQLQSAHQQMDVLSDKVDEYLKAQSVIKKFQTKGGNAEGYQAALETSARLKDIFDDTGVSRMHGTRCIRRRVI